MASKKLDCWLHNTVVTKAIPAGNNYVVPDNFLYYGRENSITLHFTPNKDASLTPAGTLAPIPASGAASPAGSIFYLLKLDQLLSTSQIRSMRFDPSWRAESYEDATHGLYWAFTPNAPITVPAGDLYLLPVTGITTDPEGTHPETATLEVAYWKVDGITGTGIASSQTASIKVEMRRLPDGPPPADVDEKFECRFLRGREENYAGFENLEVITLTRPEQETVRNGFTVDIHSKPGVETILAGPNTMLTISFPAAEGTFGALASAGDLRGIQLTRSDGAEHWSAPTPIADAETPYWKVGIPAGSPINGRLRFETVVSHIEPGFAHIAIQFHGVPGCNDGHINLPMFKYVAPYLNSASARNHSTPYSEGCLIEWDGVSINPIRITTYAPSLGPASGNVLGSDFDDAGSKDYGMMIYTGFVVGFSALGVFDNKDVYAEFGRTTV